MKFSEIKLKYSCPAATPENVYLDRLYYISKDNKGLFFTDGNYIEYADEQYIKMLFSPIDCNWKDVTFSEVTKK